MTEDPEGSADKKRWEADLSQVTRDTSFLTDINRLGGDYLSTVSSNLFQVPAGSLAPPVSSFIVGAGLSSVSDLSIPSADSFTIPGVLSVNQPGLSSAPNYGSGLTVSADLSDTYLVRRPEYEDLSVGYQISASDLSISPPGYVTPASILGSTAFDKVSSSLSTLQVGALDTWSLKVDKSVEVQGGSLGVTGAFHLDLPGFDRASAATVHRYAEYPGVRGDLIAPASRQSELDPAFASLIRAGGAGDLSGLAVVGAYAGDLLSSKPVDGYVEVAVSSFLATAKDDFIESIRAEIYPTRKSLGLLLEHDEFRATVEEILQPMVIQLQVEIMEEVHDLLDDLRRDLEADAERRSAIENSAAIFGPAGAAVVATAAWMNVVLGKR